MRQQPFAHKKSLGQNFLTSTVVPNWMCEAGRIQPGDQVLEIGPGTGALTRTLLDQGAVVHAIETDARAITVLQTTFASEIAHGTLQLIEGDARTLALDTVLDTAKPYKVVANIPYYLSGFLLRTVLELPNPPILVVFLMQKEVVHRITREEKASLLSLSVQVYGQPTYVRTVSRGHFNPPPQVDSAILLIDSISHTAIPTKADQERFFAHLHQGLGQKRKQLLGALAQTYDRAELSQIFTHQGLRLDVRGEDLSVTKWLALSKALTAIPTLST